MSQPPTQQPAVGARAEDTAKAEILSGLLGILRNELGVFVDGDAGPQTFESLDVDSLSMVEFVVAAEERFGVSMRDDDIRSLKTLDDAVRLIQRKRADQT